MPEKPLVILHGWSDSWESFQNLARFFAEEADRSVEIINLADWLSLDDEVTYHDLAESMQRQWKKRKLPTSPRSVDVVVHSTGGLLIREWMTRYYDPDSTPIEHLLMLAPANFGSPLAHKGRAFYGRIIKGWRTGLQTGTRILRGLELGSAYSWKLAEKDILSNRRWYGKNGVMATVLIGDTGYGGVRAAANEDGSDGTVRIATANLNAARLEVDFSKNPGNPTWSVKEPKKEHRTAFTIIEGDTHGSIIMKAKDTPNNQMARDLFKRALSVKASDWDAWCSELDGLTQDYSSKTGWRKDPSRHLYQNTVIRVADDVGNAVDDYFVEFFEHDADTSSFGAFFHRDVLRSVHAHSSDKNYRNMNIDVTLLHHRIDRPEVDSLEIGIHAEPQMDLKAKVGYLSETSRIKLDVAHVKKFFGPYRTLLVDIRIRRELKDVFRFFDTPVE